MVPSAVERDEDVSAPPPDLCQLSRPFRWAVRPLPFATVREGSKPTGSPAPIGATGSGVLADRVASRWTSCASPDCLVPSSSTRTRRTRSFSRARCVARTKDGPGAPAEVDWLAGLGATLKSDSRACSTVAGAPAAPAQHSMPPLACATVTPDSAPGQGCSEWAAERRAEPAPNNVHTHAPHPRGQLLLDATARSFRWIARKLRLLPQQEETHGAQDLQPPPVTWKWRPCGRGSPDTTRHDA